MNENQDIAHTASAKSTTHPLFRGKNKFITIGVAVVVLTVAIALPIVLPLILQSDSTGDNTASADEIAREVASTVNGLDPDASSETKTAILEDLDDKIADATDVDSRYFLIRNKALALSKYGRHEESIALKKTLIDDLLAAKDWEFLNSTYSSISLSYSDLGDKTAAIEWMQKTIDVCDSLKSDSAITTYHINCDYYTELMARVNNS